MKKILFTPLSAPTALTVSAGKKNNLRYVDPYIGVCVPFGTVQTGLQNIFKGWGWYSGYNYSDNVLSGFCTPTSAAQAVPTWVISGSCPSLMLHHDNFLSSVLRSGTPTQHMFYAFETNKR